MIFLFNKKLLDLYVNSRREGGSDYNDSDLMLEYDERLYRPVEDLVKKNRPSKWGFRLARRFRRLQNSKNLSPMIKEFMQDYWSLLWDALRTPIEEGSIPRTTISAISDLNKRLPVRNLDKPDLLFIPIEEFSIVNPKFTYRKVKKVTYLGYQCGCDRFVEIPLMDQVWLKGGDVRVVLKGLFNDEYIDKEIPLNDHDICVRDYNIGKNYLQIVGEDDLSGIEIFDDIVDVIASRDVDMNQGLLSADGIYYTQSAKDAIISGFIHPIGADQGVFGKGTFTVNKRDTSGKIEKIKIFKPRIAYERTIKFVVEGKTRGLIIDDNNLQLFMGIYLMVSFCRLVKKEDRSSRIEKIYYLLKEMGILDHYKYVFKQLFNIICDNVFDLFEYSHILYPFFELEAKGRDDQVAQWLIMKLNKWLRNEFRATYKLYSKEFYDSLVIDSGCEKKIFTLDNFQSDPILKQKIDIWIPGFLERSRARNIVAGSMLATC